MQSPVVLLVTVSETNFTKICSEYVDKLRKLVQNTRLMASERRTPRPKRMVLFRGFTEEESQERLQMLLRGFAEDKTDFQLSIALDIQERTIRNYRNRWEAGDFDGPKKVSSGPAA